MQIVTRTQTQGLSKVRLIVDGTNEIVSVFDALSKADEAGLDLVIVSDKSTPPVVRIEDFRKLEYEKKKAKAKHGKTTELKEIQLKVNISDHDLDTKLSAINKFLERGDKVKVMVRLRGRERETPERAQALLNRVFAKVTCKVSSLPGPITQAILEAK